MDYCISPEAIDSTDVLAATLGATAARTLTFAKLPKVESLKEADAIQDKLALSSAIDGLREDLISLYVSVEEIHWHLRVKRHGRESWYAFFDQAEVARQLSGYILCAIVRSICINEKLAGKGDCDALLKAVLALQAENEALAPRAAPSTLEI